MGNYKTILFISAFLIAGVGLVGLISAQKSISRKPRASLYDSASFAPVTPQASDRKTSPTPLPSTRSVASTPASTPAQDPAPVASPTVGPSTVSELPSRTVELETDGALLKDSQARLDAIDNLNSTADQLFDEGAAGADADDPAWSVNEQNMDQQDYHNDRDGADITKWYSQDESGNGVVQAEEAQLANGEMVDRWYGPDGTLQQTMHQFDRRNSYSEYKYPTGETEAIRIVKDGAEYFTRFARDGSVLQRTYTPAQGE